MNLRIIPAIPSQPTLVSCQDFRLPVPRNPLAFDKAVGFHLLIDSVTFDLARQIVSVAWVDSRSMEWSVNESQGLKQALEDVMECVRMSGVEADQEKKAAATTSPSKTNTQGHARSANDLSSPSSSLSSPTSSIQIRRHNHHRISSRLFSSLITTLINPPATPSLKGASIPANTSSYFSSTHRRDAVANRQVYHRQHIFHPSNKRETLPSIPVAQYRYLRQRARAKIVDIFRYHVASHLTRKMRDSDIMGEEERYGDSKPGTGGFAAVGGYVAYMARSMLRKALSEISEVSKDEESWSNGSSRHESLSLTPKDQDDTPLAADVPSDCGADCAPSKKTALTPSSCSGSPAPLSAHRSSPRASTAASPQTQQIRHLSSVLIDLIRKDNQDAANHREMMDRIEERALRRRWSLAETTTSPKSVLPPRDLDSSRKEPKCQDAFGKPLVSSPLREVEVLYSFGTTTVTGDVPFPSIELSISPSSPLLRAVLDEWARPRCAARLPITRTSFASTSPPRSSTGVESSDLIAIQDFPSLPLCTTPIKTPRSMSCPSALVLWSSLSSFTSESSAIRASRSEEDGHALSALIVKHVNNTHTIYTSTNPKSPNSSPVAVSLGPAGRMCAIESLLSDECFF
ncbi:hypothetical protein FRB96_004287 [Tulasnella sp. 330]|nr:hypothetical protein FRB96_004287 [Tulasnella sp. 330]